MRGTERENQLTHTHRSSAARKLTRRYRIDNRRIASSYIYTHTCIPTYTHTPTRRRLSVSLRRHARESASSLSTLLRA